MTETASQLATLVAQLSDFALVVVIIVLAIVYRNVIASWFGLKQKPHDFNGGQPVTTIKEVSNKVARLETDVNKIKDNHLVHLQNDVTAIKQDVAYIKGKLSK